MNLKKLSTAALSSAALLAPDCVDPAESPNKDAGPHGVDAEAPSTGQEPPGLPGGGSGAGEGSAAGPPPGIATEIPLSIASRCEDIPKEGVLAAVYEGPRLPPGYAADPPEKSAWAKWGKGCSDDLSALTKDAQIEAESSAGWLTGASRSTPFYHEMDIALVGGAYTVHYRKTRCDYFDGERLAREPSAAALAELAVYLWYSRWSTTVGYSALSVTTGAAGGAYALTLCEARTTFGDCGLCDDIAVSRSIYTLSSDGAVNLPSKLELVGLVKGHCNN